ncbi:General secretion pathway protein F [hydrothermal vent metagenome]|uniref:General secretion pathway protein F n=1 Tax=hydrothermal vent metagenome TaxID=652676 RepID=A0A1W1C164_9ZZZZ
MLFKYKGVDQSGNSTKGTITANSIQEAKQKLRTQSIYYEKIEEARSLSLEAFSKRQMSGPLLSNFARELSSYLNSGMTVVTAIKLLENQHQDEKRYSEFLSSIKSMIEEGKSLYNALANQKVYYMPDFFLQSINIASQSGKIVEVLTNMGNFFSAQSKIKKQVGNAMAYPLFILIVAISMSGFLIAFVVPKITNIFKDTGQELPPITQVVLGASDFLIAHYVAILVGFVLTIVLFKLAIKKSYMFKKSVDKILLKLPVIGSLIQNYELGRFSYILSLMLSSGVSYAQSVQLGANTFNNTAFKDLFENAAEKVLEGNKLSTGLQLSNGVKPKRNFMQALALGEESSEVANILGNISQLYQEENEDRLKMLLSLLEPFMMLLIGAIVGVIVAAMLLPIFSMSLGAQG